MAVKKIIEVLATSESSFEDAVQNAIEEASKTVHGIRSVYVKEMNAKVEDNEITTYGVTTKITFDLER